MTHRVFPILGILTVFLVGCDSGDGFSGDNLTIVTDNSGSSTTETVSSIRIGRGDSTFIVGEVEIGLPEISAGGLTSLKVRLVDDTGSAYKTPVEVNFISRCSNLDPQLATITSPVLTVNGVAESTYRAIGCVGDDPINASATIVNQQLENSLTDGSVITASGTLKIKDPIISSIQYVSADPTNMVLKGLSGGAQQSTVTFRVVDISGNPVADQPVSFALTTDIGDLEIVGPEMDDLNKRIANTDGHGLARAILRSGHVPTSVRVIASTTTATGENLATQSEQLVLTTGLPDSNSASLATDTLNVEGAQWVRTLSWTAHLADRFNNTVPNGTAVSFMTEGGSIVGSCLTGVGQEGQTDKDIDKTLTDNQHRAEGRCSVNHTTSNPHLYDSRVTVMATALGEEAFIDVNGNGVFDANDIHNGDGTTDFTAGDYFDVNGNGFPDASDFDYLVNVLDTNRDGQFSAADFVDITAPADGKYNSAEDFFDFNGNGAKDIGEDPTFTETSNVDSLFDNNSDYALFYDLPEAWLDNNENGQYDLEEPFKDFNKNGIYDNAAALRESGQAKYNGATCEHNTLCSTTKNIFVSAQTVVVFSSSTANISFYAPNPKVVSNQDMIDNKSSRNTTDTGAHPTNPQGNYPNLSAAVLTENTVEPENTGCLTGIDPLTDNTLNFNATEVVVKGAKLFEDGSKDSDAGFVRETGTDNDGKPILRTFSAIESASSVVCMRILGENGQLMPAGTEISVESSNGTVDGDISVTVPNSNTDPRKDKSAGIYVLTIAQDTEDSETFETDRGYIAVTVTTPDSQTQSTGHLKVLDTLGESTEDDTSSTGG